MDFGLIIIGDEIIHGRRTDKHFSAVKDMLEARGLRLAWVQYLPDDRTVLIPRLAASFAEGRPTFVTGGIGGTPDDHTRQAAAQALGVPLLSHPEAAALIASVSQERGDSLNSPAHQQRLNMADFPQGAEIIPNPYNRIAGFSIREHYFVPGFPVMAHPMLAWVLDHHYPHLFHQIRHEQRASMVFGLPESRITPLMQHIEASYPGIKSFSLPTLRDPDHLHSHPDAPKFKIEFGLKASGAATAQLDQAWAEAQAELTRLGGHLQTMAATE